MLVFKNIINRNEIRYPLDQWLAKMGSFPSSNRSNLKGMIQAPLSALLILATSSVMLCACDKKMESVNQVAGRSSPAIMLPAKGAIDGVIAGDPVAVEKSACLSCHANDNGPALAPPFAFIAKIYSENPDGKNIMASSLRNGSHDKWVGYQSSAMPPKPQLSTVETNKLIQWVLDQQKATKATPSQKPGAT